MGYAMFRTLSCLWGLLALGIVLAGARDQKPVRVIVPAEAEVQNSRFTLGEIAQLNDGDEPFRERLSAIELGASPLPGQERLYTRQQLQTRLRQQKIEMERIHLEMPGTIRLSRTAQAVKSDQLLAFAREQLRLAMGTSAEGWTPENAPVLPALPRGDVQLAPDGVPRTGINSAQVGIQIRQNDKTIARVIYTFRAPAKKRAVLIRSGEQVSVLVNVDEVTLETSGHARSSGAEGEMISVYLSETKRTVRARIIEKGLVQIIP